MKTTIKASIGILTFNSEATLEKALESVKQFDDIIICDGGSTDNTRAIASNYGATIIDQDKKHKNRNGTIANFSGVRNQMLDAAKYDWFLFVDSDEYLSEESSDEIRGITQIKLNDKSTLAYWMPRKRVYKGKIVECTTTYPSYQMRFFHKSGVNKFIKEVHERIEVKDDTIVGYLKECEYVPFDFTKNEWKQKLEYYLQIEAKRQRNNPLNAWLKHTVIHTFKLSILYGIRHLKILLFCRKPKMPIWYELMQHWYHWRLMFLTGRKYFKKDSQL